MADWYGSARSNYFRVKDLEAFKAAMENIEVEVVGTNQDNSVGEDGRVALLVTQSDKGGWPSEQLVDDDEYDDLDLPALIAEHLADDEVAILMECGAEKLRYLTGWAIAFNNRGDKREVSLNDIYELAGQLGAGDVTGAEY